MILELDRVVLNAGRDSVSIEARASRVLALGLARFQADERDDEHMLLPLYLRPSEAERLWALRHPKENA